MTSIDELFNRSKLSAGAYKRKFEAPDPQQAFKAAKLSATASPSRTSAEDRELDDTAEAGPDLPPDDDDEGGRFFGTGITHNAEDALDYIGQQDGDGAAYEDETIDSAWLRKLATSFERKVIKNAELRAKFGDEPQKFMASEADLDDEIKSWSLLTDHSELYAELAQMEALGSLVGLLAHENTDIAIAAIQIVSEFLDEDVEAKQEDWDALVTALLDANLMELLMSNLGRLDEENESDRNGVYHTLSVIESLAGQQSIAEKIGTEKMLLWLCERTAKDEKPVGQNKQYAAEVLQVLLQSSSPLRRSLATNVEGVDLFLRLLSRYRKRDPQKDSHEEEYLENLFDALTCVVDEAVGKREFVKAEGVELCGIMLKEGTKNIMHRALRVLDHAVGGQGAESTEVCEKVVDAALLKPLFGIFMKKADNETIEHLLGIFSALLRLLPGDSAARIRALAKFAEKDYEKLEKMALLRQEYARRIAVVEKEIQNEQKTLSDDEMEERADEWFSRRLDGGLFCLQMVDVILAWLIAEDAKIKQKLVGLLEQTGGLKAVQSSLREQKDGLEGNSAGDEDTREMLETLIEFLG